MGLFQKAIETYDAMESLAGKSIVDKETLAPIGHMITTASIEITVDADGNFVRAQKIDKKIPIPCTEESAGRSSAPAAHPLCDNLTYVGEIDENKHNVYLEEVCAWTESEYGNPKLDVIYKYLLRNHVLTDLKKAEVIELDDKGKLKEEKALVTWRVEGLGAESGAVYEDQQLMHDFFEFYMQKRNPKKGLCMASGEEDCLAVQHLKGVSNFSGNAKLISSNDTSNFTYRGRFLNSDEALTVGYVSSQKAHNALKWLLSNYGIGLGDRRLVAWNPKGKEIPKVNLPLLEISNNKVVPSDYKEQLKKVLNGYKETLPSNDSVVIAAFEAATSGRLSVTYYNELQGSDFLDRLYDWDMTCCWYDNRWGTGSPLLFQIISFAFGTQRENGKVECDNKILSQQMQRLISCRVDRTLFPRDILRNLIIKSSNIRIYSKENADKLLFTTCAVIKKCKHDYLKEEWEMALDETSADRSYLFGRLLAVLEMIEKKAIGDEERETNAIRIQAFFCQRPLTAFSQIMTNLKTSYYPRLGSGIKVYYEKLIGEIMDKISLSPEDEIDKPLAETYLLGYYLQKNAFYTKKETKESEEE